MDEDPRIHIVRRPPQPHEGPLRNDPQLVRKRSGESRRRGLVLPILLSDSLALDVFYFVEGLLEFWGIAPDVRPVTISDPRRESCTDRVEHVFSRIDVVRAHRAITSEVVTDYGRVSSDVTEIDLHKDKGSVSNPKSQF